MVNKTFELFASLWACSRTGLCALCCLSIASNELSLNEHPGTGLGAGNTKKMVIHSLPFVMTWLLGCPREKTNMSRRKGLFYLNSVKAKKSRWKGRKTASLITGMVKSGMNTCMLPDQLTFSALTQFRV